MKSKRFGIVVLAITVVVAALTAALIWGSSPGSRSGAVAGPASAAPQAGSAAGAVAVPITLEDVVVEPPAGGFPVGEAGTDGAGGNGQGDGGQGGEGIGEQDTDGEGQDDQGQDTDGQGGGQPADPCADGSGRLAVTPDPLTLPAGATKGGVTVHNCGAEPVEWTSATKPWVALSAAQGTLDAGATTELGFTVDDGDLPIGPYTFRIKVSEPGHNVYVDVEATKGGGFADPGQAAKPTGCAADCITKAWLTPRHGSPDLDLEVRTDVAAKIFVEIATEAPMQDDHDRPYFPEAELKRSTEQQFRSMWETELTPLSPGTRYHVIVVAVDKQGERSTAHGTFTTTDPVTGLSSGEAGGCSSNCVASAILTPENGSPDQTLTVRAHVPATFAVFLSDEEPHTNGAGEPYFPGVSEPAAASEQPATEWDAELQLEYGTTYRIILRAIDEQGRPQFKQGQFETAHRANDVLVTFHKIHVSDDADGSLRGEMRFEFEVAGQQRSEIAVGERKVDAPEWIDLDRGDRGEGRSVAAYGVPDQLSIRVQAWERDRHDDEFGWQFCDKGSDMFDEVSGRVEVEECDIDLEWNTAVGMVDLHADTSGNALPPCYGMDGITGDVCAILEAGGDDPRFMVYVTIDFIE